MKKVLALTAIEAPFRSRLIETQFFDPLVRARNLSNGRWQLSFLSVIPLAFYLGRRNPWRQYVKNSNQNKTLRSNLASKGVKYRTSLAGFPLLPRQFNLRKNETALFIAAALPRLIFKLAFLKPDLMIARSYPAALLAWWAKRISNIPYLFDLRGMYPEESVNAGRYEINSPDYLFWKGWEKKLVSSARYCLVVSQPFVEHVLDIYPGARVEMIPCCVDPGKIRLPDKEKTKAKYGLGGRFVLLHLGSFGTPGDRGLAGKYLLRFKEVRPDAVLVVASGTAAFGPAIRKALLGEGLGSDDFRIYHPVGPELEEMLALGDAGLILERKVANTKVCLSVKLGEYLAAGLPVICTPHVEGVARLIEKYRCGLVVDPDQPEPPDRAEEMLKDYEKHRSNGFKMVEEILAIDRCADKWRSVIDQGLKT
ncbi:MAG: glycosyltransferase [Candidatus Edwardsbacteria bacterium]|nr:glycosyltransferase [Candidatus Edwardsbacteria bacterium]